MHLLIDEGNTKTKFALCTSYQDIQAVSEDKVLEQIESIESIVLSTVVTHTRCQILHAKAKEHKIEITNVKVKSQEFGIHCAYEKPSNLGIDRWLAILGAELLYPNCNLLIVDAGTAITCDVLTDKKQHLGGWITPGLMLMRNTIVEKAPGVFSSEKVEQEVFGTDTPSALYQGCVNACVGLVEQAIYKAKQECGSNELTTLLTGGDSKLIAQEISEDVAQMSELVFVGMSRYIEHSSKN